jgi:proliferating cell nuclear antigen
MPLKVQTVQGVVVRSLIDALSSILCDVNLRFKPGEGVIITDLDFSRVAMVHCRLEAEKFEVFEADKEYTVGLYVQHLNSILRMCAANDTLSFYVEDESSTEFVIEVRNAETQQISVYKMFMMDVDEDNLTLPERDFQAVTYMPAQELQRIFRDMMQISDAVTIRSTRTRLIFEARGDYCSAQRQFLKSEQSQSPQEAAGASSSSQDETTEAQGTFVLKYLKLFAKAASVSNFCEIYLKDNFPIVLKYDVASLGTLHFCLAPRTDTGEELMVDC